MKARTFTTMGALHPVLFFAGVYIVALLFSIFICSSLFYSCNSSSATMSQQEKAPVQSKPVSKTATAAVVMR
jgi:hypothetical protein